MSASSYVGTILPQFGTLAGAKVFVEGVDITPDSVQEFPPTRVGRNGKGRPFYQGRMRYVLHWEEMTLDEFQRLAVLFYPRLGTFAGPLVTVILPEAYQAGRFVQATAYMEWPTYGRADVVIRDVNVELSSFKLAGDA